MSLSMFLTTKSRNIRAVFEAFVLCTDGGHGASQSHAKRSVQVGAPHLVGSARWERFMRRGDLETLCAANGEIRFVCGVMVVLENPIAVPVPDAGEHLGRLLDRADASDVSFSVRGHIFHAHRAVLAARSPVFSSELLGPMAEAKLQRITLHEIEPATFRSLLWFVYTDALPPRRDLELAGSPVDIFQHLLVAADRYALGRLKLVCAHELWEILSADNVAAVLSCAEMYNCPELKDSCMDFIVAEKNFKKAVFTEGYTRLSRTFPSIVAELRKRVGT
jgi:speckle-type POZ protein